jgi:SAM-dependent methyltransferase
MGGRDNVVAGGGQAYLRDVQYRDSSRLAARARLHVKYGTAAMAWFPWLATQVAWPEGARVLEVGCGAGWMWAEASARLPIDLELTLTDLSPGMVTEALDRVGSLGRYRQTVGRVADVQELPFRDAAFDVVVANYVLHHVPDAGRAVAEMARVLHPDGVAVVACVGDGHLAELHQIRREVFGDGWSNALTDTSFGARSGARLLPTASAWSTGARTTTASTAETPTTSSPTWRRPRRSRTPTPLSTAGSSRRCGPASTPRAAGCR